MFKGKSKKQEEGGAHSRVNKSDFKTNDPPLTGGEAYQTKKLMEKMPFSLGQRTIRNNNFGNDKNWENKDSPNLFALWIDVYETFIGSYVLTKCPDSLKDHEMILLHSAFMTTNFALHRIDEDNWISGTYTSTKVDNYGDVIEGTFFPSNQGLNSKKQSTSITTKNNKDFVTGSISIWKIPLFVVIGYFVRLKKLLYMFKRSNLGFSILKKILLLESNGQEVLIEWLTDIFNQGDEDFIAPIQVINATSSGEGKDKKFTIGLTDINKTNQVDLKFDYQGVLINGDIEGLNKEIFRVAGLRTDLVSKSGEYMERSTETQVKQSTSYFDARERFVLMGLNKFSRQFKKKFNLEMKWESIYKIEKEEEAIREKEIKKKEINDETSSI